MLIAVELTRQTSCTSLTGEFEMKSQPFVRQPGWRGTEVRIKQQKKGIWTK